LFFVLIAVLGHAIASETSYSKKQSAPGLRNEEWTEWRGGSKQGLSDFSAPVQWSESDNVRWKCELPGRGTSSPIVKDDLVIVTTSYLAKQASQLHDTLTLSVLVLAGVVVVLGLRLLSDGPHHGVAQRLPLYRGSFASILTLLTTLVVFGPAILDFDRCPIRAWLGGSLVLSLVLLLALAGCPDRSTLRPILGVAGITVSVVALEWLPSKSHAFRNGWTGTSSWVVFVVSCCPLLIGAIAIARAVICRFPIGRRGAKLILSAAAVLFLIADLYLGSGIVSTPVDPDHPDGIPHGVLYAPTCAWMLVSLVWTLHSLALLVMSRSPREQHLAGVWRERLTSPAMIVIASTLATVTGVCVLTTQGLYLPYHLAVRRIEPLVGWRPFLAVCVVSLVALPIVQSPRLIPRFKHLGGLFQCCVLLLGLTAFASENLTRQEQVLTRAILAVDRETGQARWKCEGLNKPEGPLHRYNSAASATAVVRDGRVFAWFGSAGVLCCDLRGQMLWTNDTITFESAYGAGASPVVADGVMVIVSGTPENGYVCGLSCETGKQLWRRPLIGEAVSGNSRTPVIEQVNGKPTVLVWGYTGVLGLDVSSGDESFHYKIGNGGGDQVATLVRDERTLCCIGATESTALSLDRVSDNAQPPIVWRRSMQAANCASPTVTNSLAFCVTDAGVASCLNLKTGKTLWRQRLPGTYYASPIVCRDLVYFTNLDGTTTVIEAATKCRQVAENQLPGQFLASPAPVDGEIFFRSDDRLYCISQSTGPQSSGAIVRNDEE